MNNNRYDVIIVGGSYAGLAAAMSLGRALKKTLIIDSGLPCNRQTPHSHNFLTQDGKTPAEISALAKEQVLKYDTVRFHSDLAVAASRASEGFEVTTGSNQTFYAKKLVFATGLSDQMPAIEGFAECWGISVVHCPYCHGYEIRNQTTGLLGNGDLGFELCKLISNWSRELVLFTNGPSTLSEEQLSKIRSYNVEVIETPIKEIEHENGNMQRIILSDGSGKKLKALYARPAFTQHCKIPEQLGCEITEEGLIKVDDFQKTTVEGIYAAGDCTTMFRSVAVSVASGTKAGAVINKDLISETF